MPRQPSVILIVPYFGCWPQWFEYFLKSCTENPTIHWLFYTDCSLSEEIPANISFKEIKFYEYKKLVSDQLGICFSPDNPYKLCDLKPALGYIHEHEIKAYDFWGVSDIDLVYGDLRSYFTNERLNKYEFHSTHKRRVSGHLFLAKNNKKMREAFMQIKDWEKLLSDQEHYALDEGAFSRLFIKQKNLPSILFDLLAKFNPWARASDFREAFSTPNGRVPWHDNSYNFPNKWYWASGKLTNDIDGEREFPYFHFIAWKQNEWADSVVFEQISAVDNEFCLTRQGIHQGNRRLSNDIF